MNNPVVWFEIYVQDTDRAKKFYETVMAVELTDMSPPGGELAMLAFPGGPDGQGAAGAIVKTSDMPSGGNSTLVYFRCDDCAVEEARLAEAGGAVARPKMSIGENGFITLATDPDGNMFGLHSMK